MGSVELGAAAHRRVEPHLGCPGRSRSTSICWRRSMPSSWRRPTRCRPKSVRRWPRGDRASSTCPERSGCATRTLRKRWYPHSPDPGQPVTYGLTERYRAELEQARLIACAGCYPTAAILSLQPLAAAGLLEPGIIIDAKSGVSGAGKTPTERTHFSEIHGSIAAYGVFGASSWRRDRTGGRTADHVRAAPGAARPRHPRDDLRAAEARRRQRGDYADARAGVLDKRPSCG